jgi:signal transduction histidine kinase
MSLLEIIKLVGFATGAALHLYIAWLIWQRRLGSRKNLNQVERTFIVLGLCLGVWFIGNLLISLHELLLTRERLTAALRAWDTLTMIGVALLPAALLHAHVAFYAMMTRYSRLSPRKATLTGVALYTPMLFLPYAVYLIATGPYESFLIKLRPLLLPYSIWFLVALWSAAAIDLKIKDRLDAKATRERAFFKRLALTLVFNGAFEFYVVAVARSGPNDPLWIIYVLLGMLPTFLVAYHVYRYKIVDVAIKDSLVYAAFAVAFIAIYTYGIRRLDEILVARVGARPGVVEAILILGMFALAGPLVRLMDRMVRRLFASEFGLYRDVVRRVSAGAAGFGELNSLALYAQETIRQGLELESVRIVRLDEMEPDGPDRRIAQKMIQWEADIVEANEDLARVGATAAYALRREGELIGIMVVSSEPHTLTSEKRAVLDVLAGQVAIELEAGRLVDEKVRLERELAQRERLATLGQMAATVAHEVKNPLSSIKSIAQVMREEPALAEYDRDLALIVAEIDRLNRTVSQLLAFSRPSYADMQPVSLREMIDSTLALLGHDARESGVKLDAEVRGDATLAGPEASALREALSNLILNAIQAAGSSGEVRIEAGIGREGGAPRLVLSVTDTGPGIPRDAQHRVFEPFYTTKSRGTGLGLAIVQRRATELGGVVDLLSPVADNYGTRFRLITPLSQP